MRRQMCCDVVVMLVWLEVWRKKTREKENNFRPSSLDLCPFPGLAKAGVAFSAVCRATDWHGNLYANGCLHLASALVMLSFVPCSPTTLITCTCLCIHLRRVPLLTSD